MAGAVRVVEGLAGAVGVFLFWILVVIVIPGIAAVYVSRLFPLTGEWQRRWRERRRKA